MRRAKGLAWLGHGLRGTCFRLRPRREELALAAALQWAGQRLGWLESPWGQSGRPHLLLGACRKGFGSALLGRASGKFGQSEYLFWIGRCALKAKRAPFFFFGKKKGGPPPLFFPNRWKRLVVDLGASWVLAALAAEICSGRDSCWEGPFKHQLLADPATCSARDVPGKANHLLHLIALKFWRPALQIHLEILGPCRWMRKTVCSDSSPRRPAHQRKKKSLRRGPGHHHIAWGWTDSSHSRLQTELLARDWPALDTTNRATAGASRLVAERPGRRGRITSRRAPAGSTRASSKASRWRAPEGGAIPGLPEQIGVAADQQKPMIGRVGGGLKPGALSCLWTAGSSGSAWAQTPD